MSKSVSCRSKQEKKKKYSFYASNRAIKYWLDETGVGEVVKVGVGEIEVADSTLTLWQSNGNGC